MKFGEVIGSGGQGVVQRAIIQDQHVALKSCTIQSSQFSALAKEIKLLK